MYYKKKSFICMNLKLLMCTTIRVYQTTHLVVKWIVHCFLVLVVTSFFRFHLCEVEKKLNKGNNGTFLD